MCPNKDNNMNPEDPYEGSIVCEICGRNDHFKNVNILLKQLFY
jgi:hypothetical protein